MNDGSVNLHTLRMAALLGALVAAAAASVALVAAAAVALVVAVAAALVATAAVALVAAAAEALVAAAGEAAAEAAVVAVLLADNPPPDDEEVPTFTQFVNALFENLSIDNDPDLQVEAAHKLIVLFDQLTLSQQHDEQDDAVGFLLGCLQLKDDDEVAWAKAGALVREIINGNCDLRRNLILGPIVRGVMENDAAIQWEHTINLGWILRIEPDPPVRGVVETGIVPRLVKFLGRNDVPDLQCEAARVLAGIANESDHTAVVVNANAIGPFVRLLRSPHENVQKHAVSGVLRIARRSPEVVLQAGAVGPLVAVALQTRVAVDAWPVCRSATTALRVLCDGEHEPPFELFRPVLPAWAQLADCQNAGIVENVCYVLARLSATNDDGASQDIIDAGVCPRLVELLSHPSLDVQWLASWTVGNLVAGNIGQGQPAILDPDPLPSLMALFLSPHFDVQRAACRAIGSYLINEEQVQAVIDGDVVPTLIQFLSRPEVESRKTAAVAILKCVTYGTVDQIQDLVGEGCIQPLCGLLIVDANDPHLVMWVIAGLVGILRAGSELEPQEGSNPMAMLIASALSGKRSMLQGLRHSHPDAVTRAYVHEILEQFFPIQ